MPISNRLLRLNLYFYIQFVLIKLNNRIKFNILRLKLKQSKLLLPILLYFIF